MITGEALLRLLDDELGVWFPLTRREAYERLYNPKILTLEDYFPSVVKRVVSQLERKGMVTKEERDGGVVIMITDNGKRRVLRFKLDELEPKSGKWDGNWRVVLFDIGEVSRYKRDLLRKYLKKLGMMIMQESVFIGPYDVSGEVEYLREILDVPHAVKMMLVTDLENKEDLVEAFGL